MITQTKFKDLFIIKNKSFNDKRGYFKELIRENRISKKFPFLVMSYSKKNVIRGLHLQKTKSQGKFVTVIKGKIFDVAVDLRKNSKTFGKSFSIILSEKNCKSIFIPSGFIHGFLGLDNENIVKVVTKKNLDNDVKLYLQHGDFDRLYRDHYITRDELRLEEIIEEAIAAANSQQVADGEDPLTEE